MLLYGEEKVGKSTFAMSAPATAYLAVDNGTSDLAVRGRMPTPATMAEFYELLAELEAGTTAHGFETLVIDPINWLEDKLVGEMLAEQPGTTLNSWGKGYGAGPKEARRRWRELIKAVERVWAAGLGIVFVAHRMLEDFKDPEGADYKRFVPAIKDAEMRGAIKQWVDAILHAHVDAYGHLGEDGKIKARGTGERVLQTEHKPAADGGNRWELTGELAMPRSDGWRTVMSARPVERIEAHLLVLGDAELEKKVRALLADGKSAAGIEAQLAAKAAKKKEAAE